ncbi:MAG: MaoC family dehydratase [Bacteroidia bacterium]|nr:MaoC family dehydratase [Bacteroidia bacterium]
MEFSDLAALRAAVGMDLGASGWRTVTQDMIDGFARATGDFQWIHTDPERARRESPTGTTLAHGFLTLSLAAVFAGELLIVHSGKMSVNYGLEQVRFTHWVPVGSQLCMKARISACEPYQQGVRLTLACTFFREDSPKPVCNADWVMLIFE